MDGLRFIAIFSVILFHLDWMITSKVGGSGKFNLLAQVVSHGDTGVQLFFVISSFVIALPFARAHFGAESPPKLLQYFSRRLTRLAPPYIVNLLLRYALLLLLTEETAYDLFPHLFASMGYFHNVMYGEMSRVNCVAWSLEVELQFYLLAPVLTKLFLVRSTQLRRGLLITLIAFFSLLSFAVTPSPRFDLSILAAAQYFLTGFLLLDVYLVDWGQRPEKSHKWDVVSLLSWSAICTLDFLGDAGELFMVIPMFFAYVSTSKGALATDFFLSPPSM